MLRIIHKLEFTMFAWEVCTFLPGASKSKGSYCRQIAFATGLFVFVFFVATRLEFQTHRHLSDASQGNVSLLCDEHSQQKLSTDFQVPNIVHYIWYHNDSQPMKFHEMLSVLSAHKMLQPDAIYFHTNVPPTGKYWERLRELKNFKVIERQPPEFLFDEKLKWSKFRTAGSNVDRLKVLLEYGGIYLDLDVLVVKSFDELRKYPCTIGREAKTRICGGIVVCSKESAFLRMWANAFLDDYKTDVWAYNTGAVPTKLAKRFPDLVHVEPTRLHSPNYMDLDWIWGSNRYNWRKNYAIHLWWTMYAHSKKWKNKPYPDEEAIKSENSTFAEIARMILYDT